jgi:hypothetical protein
VSLTLAGAGSSLCCASRRARDGIPLIPNHGDRKLEFAKDSENKRFLDSLFGKVTLVTATAIAVGAAVLGGKVLAQREESDA